MLSGIKKKNLEKFVVELLEISLQKLVTSRSNSCIVLKESFIKFLMDLYLVSEVIFEGIADSKSFQFSKKNLGNTPQTIFVASGRISILTLLHCAHGRQIIISCSFHQAWYCLKMSKICLRKDVLSQRLYRLNESQPWTKDIRSMHQ